MSNFIIESGRLGMRELEEADHEALSAILGDEKVMYAWEHGFSEEEVAGWIRNNRQRYVRDGVGYYALIEKNSGRLIGTMGPLKEDIAGEIVMGIGYILGREWWGKGYAAEGAAACAGYIFDTLGEERIVCDIRPENSASIKVAERIGMEPVGEFIKHYNGREMPHIIYELRRDCAGVEVRFGTENMRFDKITEWLADSYWLKGVSEREVVLSAQGSGCVAGAFAGGSQIGYARAVSDKYRFAYIMDVIVAPEYRGRGVGQQLIKSLLECDELKHVYHWILITGSAHNFYEKLGFHKLSRADDWYEIRKGRPAERNL